MGLFAIKADGPVFPNGRPIEIEGFLLVTVLLLSFILAMRGEPACFWPCLIFILIPLSPFLVGVAGGGNRPFLTLAVVLFVFACQVALMFQRVRDALWIRDEEFPPRWKYGKKWAGPAPKSEDLQDRPPDDKPDSVRPR